MNPNHWSYIMKTTNSRYLKSAATMLLLAMFVAPTIGCGPSEDEDKTNNNNDPDTGFELDTNNHLGADTGDRDATPDTGETDASPDTGDTADTSDTNGESDTDATIEDDVSMEVPSVLLT